MLESVHPQRQFYRYRTDTEIHVVDCGGDVDLEIGIARLRMLKVELDSRPPSNGVARLLIDFRNTVWRNESVHQHLSQLTRTELLRADNSAIRAAIVNTRWSGQISDNERWFQSEADATAWLCE